MTATLRVLLAFVIVLAAVAGWCMLLVRLWRWKEQRLPVLLRHLVRLWRLGGRRP